MLLSVPGSLCRQTHSVSSHAMYVMYYDILSQCTVGPPSDALMLTHHVDKLDMHCSSQSDYSRYQHACKRLWMPKYLKAYWNHSKIISCGGSYHCDMCRTSETCEDAVRLHWTIMPGQTYHAAISDGQSEAIMAHDWGLLMPLRWHFSKTQSRWGFINSGSASEIRS